VLVIEVPETLLMSSLATVEPVLAQVLTKDVLVSGIVQSTVNWHLLGEVWRRTSLGVDSSLENSVSSESPTGTATSLRLDSTSHAAPVN